MNDTISPTTPAPVPAFDLSDWSAQRAMEEALARQVLPANKAALFGALAKAGITSVTVVFDGYGDSGQIESIDARGNDQEMELPGGTIDIATTQWGAAETRPVTMSIRDAIERLAYDFLSESHCGWENNDGAYGEFTFTVSDQSIALDYNERFTSSEHYAHEW